MRTLVFFSFFILFLGSCTKEVQIDIPGYEELLVVDGSIETGRKPLVLLSKTADVYSPTNIEAYLNSFVEGAVISVSDGTNTIALEQVFTDELTPQEVAEVSEIMGFPQILLSSLHMAIYYPTSSSMVGEVGKTYNLTINLDGKTYTSTTTILTPTPLVDTYWKSDAGYTDRGFSWAKLADPANSYDAYKWEAKRLNGPSSDQFFMKPFNPYVDDEFFDGLTFDFAYENPMNCNGESMPEDMRCYYALGDTVVIKFSKVDRYVYDYFEKKYTQIYSAGNPFSTPTNIPSNIIGGAIGVWAGFSPTYDTLICVE
jgi:hypothetical protein